MRARILTSTVAAVAAAFLALAGCDGDNGGGADVVTGDTGGGGEDTTQAPEKLGTFLTFNAGLAYGYVDYATERQPEIGPALAALADVDVMCLQEVWAPADVAAVLAATESTAPHAYWFDGTTLPNEGEGVACTGDEANGLRTCAEANECLAADGHVNVACVQTNCGAEMDALAPACLQCLIAHISETMDAIFAACAEGSALFVYDGALGTVLLSKSELTATDYTLIDSTLNRRAVIHARTTLAGQPVALFCTHTTPEFDDIPYPGEFGTWVDEQAHQVEQMLAYVAAKAQAGDLVVLMGDMNDGPAIPPDVDGELEANFQKFLDAGFVAPYTTAPGATCTFCESNPLNPADTRNVLIDHVLLKGGAPDLTFEAARVLDDTPVTVTPAGGAETQVPLSDHYGVQVEVLRPAE